MPKANIWKIVTALAVSSIYIFLFGIVQTVSVNATNEIEISVDIPEITQTADYGTQSTPPKTTIKLDGFKKPDFEDYSAETTVEVTTPPETTTIDNVIKPPDQYGNASPEPVETAPDTQYSTTTEAPPETESTAATEETTKPVSSVTSNGAPTTPADGDMLYVYNMNTGEYFYETEENLFEMTSDTQMLVYDQTEYDYERDDYVYVLGPAREILIEATMGEISDWFPREAVKAQAVCEYTYIRKNNMQGNIPVIAMRDYSFDREYLGSCVDEVLGEGIYYNGELIQCVFFASSCGYTNSSVNVWGVDYPYLVSVDCPLDESTDPNWGSTAEYSSETVRDKVYNSIGIELTGDPEKWFKIMSRLDGKEKGWITSISVGGQTTYGSGRTIDGRTFREIIFGYGIKSSAFDIRYDKNSDIFTFTTYGHGHGVGLSQYGAKALAEVQGYNYKQILQHYFTGAEIY